MIRKSLMLVMVIALLSGATFMTYLILEEVNHKRLTRQNLETLDHFQLYDFDSVRFYLGSNRKTVVVYFDSECDHCQYELDQIFIHQNSFKGSDVILMSSELIRRIKHYAERNCPQDLGNIRFTKINLDNANEVFGSLAVPQIFIYGADGVLIKKFMGETKIDAVLQYL